ncbi:MAG TPA: PQQ-binding-like beta-propeller repeat protein, partial [Candidatus Polarisedimenticolia bacterium]|nr:PQQ-binding-like beta-propeller repeat protein [Candidatus Polarisedimenticolia bacterium]
MESSMRMRPLAILATCILLGAGALSAPAGAADWPSWRGRSQVGVSTDTGLVSSWSREGDNLIWRHDFTGRSTPVVFDGRACAVGRVGDGVDKQEMVACYDAGSGKLLWEDRFNVFHTTVPFSRVGWANPVGDPDTGYLYVHGVSGLLSCYDRKGAIVWSRSLTELHGNITGYGGRIHSPIIDEDRLILSFSNTGWGAQGPPRHRYFAFDKMTGAVQWVATPGGPPRTMTTYTNPVVAVINGQRLLIDGNADGSVYAMKARTGEVVWKFELSKQGLNSSVVVDGNRVYASSSDENIDEGSMGRVVCIDATGHGDVTKTHEVWRANELKVGYTSPAVRDGRLYVVDDSGNMYALDAGTGRILWEHSLGTVGKGSPVWADGKIFATEVNGNFHIIKDGKDGPQSLDLEHLTMSDGRYAEIYGSPAIAYGRIYVTTEEGFYCIGDKSSPYSPTPGEPAALGAEAAPADPAPAVLQVVPTEVDTRPGEPVQFRVRTYDAHGRFLGEPEAAWESAGVAGKIDATGRFTPAAEGRLRAGEIKARVGALQAAARVRVFPPLPWSEDFESFKAGDHPSSWPGGAARFTVEELDGSKVLAKPFVDQGLERQSLFTGTPDMHGYTIQADLRGTKKGRRRPDAGLIAGRYTLDLMGNHQRLQIRDWAELRVEQRIPFAWDADTWYTMKLRVDVAGDKATVLGKVWP